MTPLMKGMLDQASQFSGWGDFGCSHAGDLLNCRSAFGDIDSAMAMADRTEKLMSPINAGPLALNRLDLRLQISR